MVTSDDIHEGIRIGVYNGMGKLGEDLKKHVKGDVTFLCIGTDRSTGDCYAPMIGTILEGKGYNNVIGTLDNPIHALNLDKRIREIPEGTTVLAIDAALGSAKNVGKMTLNKGRLHAGKALDKDLTPIGDYYIVGIVNKIGYMESVILQSTRLATIMKMAKEAVSAIERAYPLNIYNSKTVKSLEFI